MVFTSCSKEDSVTPNIPVVDSRQPVAQAGNDTIMYLLNEYLLDGSGSIDSDKNILQYNRKHLSGPSDVEIDRYEKSKASASGLVKSGNYKFELIVTDADQLSSKDTVVVTIA